MLSFDEKNSACKVDTVEIWSLLRRGGLTGAESMKLAEDGLARLPKYNGLADPVGADELGSELAKLLGGLQASLVLVWENVEDVVLGHVIGRQLGVPVIRTYDEEGLAVSAMPIPAGSQGILVSDALRDGQVIKATNALLRQAGGRLVSVAVLVSADNERDFAVPIKSLVRVAPRLGDAS